MKGKKAVFTTGPKFCGESLDGSEACGPIPYRKPAESTVDV
jgi:hypothetical protein